MLKAIFIIIRLQNLVTTNYRICTSGKIISSKATTKSQLKKRFNHSNSFTFTTYNIYIYIYVHNSFISLAMYNSFIINYCNPIACYALVLVLVKIYLYILPKESLFCFCCNCLCYKVLPCCRWTI